MYLCAQSTAIQMCAVAYIETNVFTHSLARGASRIRVCVCLSVLDRYECAHVCVAMCWLLMCDFDIFACITFSIGL